MKKKLSKKKIIITSIIAVILIAIITLIVIYSFNEPFRRFAYNYMFYKNIQENNNPYINIENIKNPIVFAFDGNVAIIDGNKVKKYDSLGKKTAEIDVELTSPVIESQNQYAVLAEKNGSKLYLIKGDSVLWEKEIEGKISKVSVNKNGYVSVIVTGTTYKSEIVLFNNNGEEILKTYLSSTLATNAIISENNKELSFSETDISGTMVQTIIKTISIDKAKDIDESVLYKYEADPNSVIIDLKYQKNKLEYIFDDSVHIVNDKQDKKILDIDANKQKFIDINLANFVITINEENSDILNKKISAKFVNIDNNKENIYSVNEVVKDVKTGNDKVGIITDKNIHFVNVNGWLIKKYSSTDEVKNVVMTNSLAGVVYKNKIELISL